MWEDIIVVFSLIFMTAYAVGTTILVDEKKKEKDKNK